MKNLWIVCKNELIRYFISPLAYIYLIAFLILNGSFAIYFGKFFIRGEANLTPMFSYQLWLYLLFIPGISMRLWAEEFRQKTIVQIMTMPVSTASLVLGKFIASWLFCGLGLFLTFPFWISVNILGDPDNYVILLSYFGSFFIAGAMLSISQTMSALTKNQVIALVLAVIANLCFMLSGLEYILSFFRLFAPASIVDLIASFSFDTHFFNITQGIIELRDIIFFLSVIILFNITTLIIINFRTSGASSWFKATGRNYYILCFLFMLSGFIGINLLANTLTRTIFWDVTQEKLFALSSSTKNILKTLPEDIIIKVYYSPELGKLDSNYRLMYDRLNLLLQQYVKYSNNKLSYAIYNPENFSTAEDYAINKGLKSIPLIETNQSAYFGLTISDSLDNSVSIAFLPLERSNFLEQDLTEAIYLLNHKKKDIGILSTLPIFDTDKANMVMPRWEMLNQIEKFYNIKSISKPTDIKQDLSALIIIHPRDLNPDMIAKIREYANQGGKILAFLDIATDSERIYAPVQEKFSSSNLDGLDKSWGFEFFPEIAVADLGNSLTVNISSDPKAPKFTQDIMQFYVSQAGINQVSPITKNLKKLLVSSTSFISPLKDKNIIFTPLLASGTNSALVEADWAQNAYNPITLLKNFKKDNYQKILAAHIKSKDLQTPFEVIVVSDTDLLYDTFWSKTINTNDGNIIIPLFDNINFVLNSLDVLTGNNDLLDLRGKTAKSRKFYKIEQKRREAQFDFAIKEQDIFDKIDQTKKGLVEIWNKKNYENRQNFTPDELSIISNIRKNLNSLKKELNQIRKDINKYVNKIDILIKFFNIYAIPLLIFMIWIIYKIVQINKQKKTFKTDKIWNKQLSYLCLISFIILGCGIVSVYHNNHQGINEFENQPFFANLSKQINQVEKISLKSNQTTLEFYKDGNEWKLKSHPKLYVMQDRMRSFLSALLEARYYEKKSDKAQNLSAFGLSPISIKGSPNIEVELKDAKNKIIENFEVGKFDIDIGRGTKGAYIKFDNKFQVWLVAIELIDLSTDYKEWTLSRIWDLRFGRFLSCNHQTNIDSLAQLVKTLLNTQIISEESLLPTTEPDFSLDIQSEGNEKFKINFANKEEKYYIYYQFLKLPKNPILDAFAKYMDNNQYQISKADYMKIKEIYEQHFTTTKQNQ